MVTINLAYTSPINPEGATPVLTEAQVWAGLKRKVKRPYEFVPVISACEVESEEGNTVTRIATFKAGLASPDAPERKVREVCVHMAPSRIDFQQEDGSNVSNIVSFGPDNELLMTYSFEWRDQDEANADEQRKRYVQMAKMAVDKSIDTIRRLVTEGEIQ